MEEIKIIYEKYCMCEYDIGDVSRMLSYIAVPDSISDLVSEAENEIEYIRFMVSENEQYNRVKDVLLKILSNYFVFADDAGITVLKRNTSNE